jgi:hypothetical protein
MFRRLVSALPRLVGPLLLIALGVLSTLSWLEAQQTARAYRAAPPCSTTSDPVRDNCLTVLPATLTAATFSTSSGVTHATLQVHLGSNELRTRLDSISASEQSLLKPGTPLMTTLYRQQITVVEFDGHRLVTDDDPNTRVTRLGVAALLMLGLGILGLVVGLFGGRWLAAAILRFGSRPPSIPSPEFNAGVIYPLVVRPRSAFRSRLAFIIPFLAIGAVELYLRTRFQTVGLAIGAACLAILAVSLSLRLVYLRTVRLFADDLNVGRVGLFGATRAVPRSDAARLFICTVVQPRGPDSRRVLVLSRDGGALLKVSAEDFAMDEITAMATDLRVPVEGSWDGSFTPGELRARFPGSSGWFEDNARLIGIVIGALLCLAVTFWVLALGHR